MRFKRAVIFALAAMAFIFSRVCAAEEARVSLGRADNYKEFSQKTIRKIPIPKGYHEALLVEGQDIWVTNGKNLKTWVIDKVSGLVKSEIKPVAGFTEGISRMPDGTYAVADWDEKKIYRVRIVGDKMFSVGERSVEPAHPAGVLWNGSRLYVVIWTRGMGTKFDIIEMDAQFNTIRNIEVPDIQEPAHLAWDGRYIWITSWYSRAAYKVDPLTWKMLGEIRSPVSKATGIACDGGYIWLTGTYSDLYQLEVELQA